MDLQAPRRRHFEDMALTNIGTIIYNNGAREKTIDFYRQALDRLPDTARSHYNLAVASANTGASTPPKLI